MSKYIKHFETEAQEKKKKGMNLWATVSQIKSFTATAGQIHGFISQAVYIAFYV